MSLVQVNRILYRIEMEPAFQEECRKDPAKAIAGFDVDETERKAFLDGDVGTLFVMGAHPFLLLTMARNGICGVTRENYMPRVRAAASVGTNAQALIANPRGTK
jgi:hypothetical protein